MANRVLSLKELIVQSVTIVHANLTCPFISQLPQTNNISKIRLASKSNGEELGVIENKPGSAGSVRVYSYLLDLFGKFTFARAYAMRAHRTLSRRRNNEAGGISRACNLC